MNYIVTGGTGFIGTHLANLIAEISSEAHIYNLDVVELGMPLPTVKKLQISTNICGKKMADSVYTFKYTFEEAIADWFNDNKNQCRQ